MIDLIFVELMDDCVANFGRIGAMQKKAAYAMLLTVEKARCRRRKDQH
jgi:hypothetical protein